MQKERKTEMQRKEYVMLKRANKGKLPSFAWPGGYPLFYLCEDGGILCPDCANDSRVREEMRVNPKDFPDKSWRISAYDVNWEDGWMLCDNCNERIESAYRED